MERKINTISFLIVAVCLILSPLQAIAQTITGSVTDLGGEPLIGASVVVDGPIKNTAVTDIDGNFTISVKEARNITASYVGYKSKTLSIKSGETVYNFILEEDSQLLDDVVVVGYGTQKR